MIYVDFIDNSKKKVFNTKEFASGFSTIFMADACFILDYYFSKIKTLEIKISYLFFRGKGKFLKITKKEFQNCY